MRKDTFKKYMESNSKYITELHLRQMTEEQLAEYSAKHNPWVIELDEESNECYTKLDEFLAGKGLSSRW